MSHRITIILISLTQALSDCEALTLHSEVKALQELLGISYKDAAHRLYMAEVEHFKVEREAKMAFTKFKERIDKTILHEIYPPIMAIDKEKNFLTTWSRRQINGKNMLYVRLSKNIERCKYKSEHSTMNPTVYIRLNDEIIYDLPARCRNPVSFPKVYLHPPEHVHQHL